jgi:hypothetical protein
MIFLPIIMVQWNLISEKEKNKASKMSTSIISVLSQPNKATRNHDHSDRSYIICRIQTVEQLKVQRRHQSYQIISKKISEQTVLTQHSLSNCILFIFLGLQGRCMYNAFSFLYFINIIYHSRASLAVHISKKNARANRVGSKS